MGDVGHERADHRNYLHGEFHLGDERRFVDKQGCRAADGIGEGEPGQVANHHEQNEGGLTKTRRRAHLKNIAEHEGVDNDVGNRRENKPQKATHRRGELRVEFLAREIAEKPALRKRCEDPLFKQGNGDVWHGESS